MTYLFKKTVFNCNQATLLSIKKEEGRITFLERLKLSYHLLYCDPCRRFIDQSGRINRIGRKMGQVLSSRPPFALSETARASIRAQIDQLNG
jgi:hypothetical protein